MSDNRGIRYNPNSVRGVPTVRALRTGGGAGTSVVLPPGGGGGGGGQGPLAPNITCGTTTAATYYAAYGNLQQFGFKGTVQLPTTDPAYSHLKEIDVTAISPATASPPYQRTLITTLTPGNWGGGSQVDYQGVVDIQPPTQQTGWSVEFQCFDEFGTPTPTPCVKTGLTVGVAGIGPDLAASEVGPRYQDDRQGLHTVVQITVSMTGNQYPQTITLWLDESNGVGPIWQGWFAVNGPATIIRIGDPISKSGQTIAGAIIVPAPGNGTWKLYAAPGPIGKGPPPASASMVTFAVTEVGQALYNDVTQAQFNPNPASGDPLNYAPRTPAGYNWGFFELQFMQPTLALDPNYWFTFGTIQKGYNPQGTCTVAGDSVTVTKTTGSWNFDATWVGSDIHIQGVLTTIATVVSATVITTASPVTPGSGQTLDVWVKAPDHEGIDENKFGLYKGRWFMDSGQYQGTVSIPGTMCYLRGIQPANWDIPAVKNPDGSVNIYTTYRWRLYCSSHANDNPSAGAPGYVLQRTAWAANWDGSKDYVQLSPVAQPPNIDLTQSAVYGLNPTGAIGGGGGMPLFVKIQGPLTSDINGLNVNMGSDFVVKNGQITQNAVNMALAYGFDPTNFKGGTGSAGGGAPTPFAVNQIAVNSLIAGTALFTNDVIFGYYAAPNYGGKVLINAAGITLADNYSTPHFTTAVASTGITFAKTDTSAGVIQTQINSSGMTVQAGSYSTTVNATGITLQGPAGGGTIGITSTDVTINQGHLVIVQGQAPAAQYKIITGPQVFDTSAGSGYSSLAVQVQGVNTSPDGTFDMVSLVSRGVVVYNAPDSGQANSTHVIAALVRDPNVSPGNNAGQLVLYKMVSNSNVLKIFLNGLTGICRADGGFQIGSTVVIDATSVFTGAGVLCPTYTVGASGFNVWRTVQGDWRNGIDALTPVDSSGNKLGFSKGILTYYGP